MVKASRLYFRATLFLGLLCSTPPEIHAMHCLESFMFSSKNSFSRLSRHSNCYARQKHIQPHLSKRFYSSRPSKIYDPENPVYILSIDGGVLRLA